MPRRHERTRSEKRTHKTVPGGAKKTHYSKEFNITFYCRLCGRPLAGITQTASTRAHKLNRSRRRIFRPFGGQLCHNCLRKTLRQIASTD